MLFEGRREASTGFGLCRVKPPDGLDGGAGGRGAGVLDLGPCQGSLAPWRGLRHCRIPVLLDLRGAKHRLTRTEACLSLQAAWSKSEDYPDLL